MRRVIGNLVTNAAQFSPEGGTVRVELGVRAETLLRDGLKVTLDSLAPAG